MIHQLRDQFKEFLKVVQSQGKRIGALEKELLQLKPGDKEKPAREQERRESEIREVEVEEEGSVSI
jgi:hypothetical protein